MLHYSRCIQQILMLHSSSSNHHRISNSARIISTFRSTTSSTTTSTPTSSSTIINTLLQYQQQKRQYQSKQKQQKQQQQQQQYQYQYQSIIRTNKRVPSLSSPFAFVSSSSSISLSSSSSPYSSFSSSSSSSSSQQQQLRSMTLRDVIELRKLLLLLLNDENTTTTTSTSKTNINNILLTSYEDTIGYCTDYTKQYTMIHPYTLLQQDQQQQQQQQVTDDIIDNDLNQIILCVAQPYTIQQVSCIVQYCYNNYIGIIPIGGNTGLVGGTISSSTTLSSISLSKTTTATTTDPSNDIKSTTSSSSTTTTTTLQEPTSDNDNNNKNKYNNSVQTPSIQQQSTTSTTTIVELLLSTRNLRNHMNHIDNNDTHNDTHHTHIQFNPYNGIIQCTSGYTIYEIQHYLNTFQQQHEVDDDDKEEESNDNNINHLQQLQQLPLQNYMFPLDIGSKMQCTIGGIVATNAGGSYYYKYQSLFCNIIGIQFISGTGQIYNMNYNNNTYNNKNSKSHNNTCNLKDNTGYKLYPLLIGSEGTLGIITGVTFKCYPKLPIRQTMMISIFPSYNNNNNNTNSNNNYMITNEIIMKQHILYIVQIAKYYFGEILVAIEWMDPQIIQIIYDHQQQQSNNNNNTNQNSTSSSKTNPILNVLQQMILPSSSSSSKKSPNDQNNNITTTKNIETNTTNTTICYPHCLLIETHGTTLEHDQEKCYAFLNAIMERYYTDDNTNTNTNTSTTNTETNDTKTNTNHTKNNSNNGDGVQVNVQMSKNDTDTQNFWSIREMANPSIMKINHGKCYNYKYDISIPNSYFHLIIEKIYHHIDTYQNGMYKNRIIITNWGHVLDGNLHLNITDVDSTTKDMNIYNMIEPYIYETILQLGGSISAEHGIGQSSKLQYMNQIHDDSTLQLMHSIKHLFDPHSILNPGKVLSSLPSI